MAGHLMIKKEINKITVAGNHEYKETDSIKSVNSSLKYHPLWLTLYKPESSKRGAEMSSSVFCSIC